MYSENDIMTPRDRVNEELFQRSHGNRQASPMAPRVNCKGDDEESTRPDRATWGLENYPLASVYSPIQAFRNLYELDEALEHGTLFKELDLPFLCGERSIGGECCGK